MPSIPKGLAINIAIRVGVATALGIAMGNMGLWIPVVVIGVTFWIVRNGGH